MPGDGVSDGMGFFYIRTETRVSSSLRSITSDVPMGRILCDDQALPIRNKAIQLS